MHIAVIGAGRIGTAVADAADQAGHDVRSLHSDTDTGVLHSFDLDLAVLAAAAEDSDKYESFEDFRSSLSWLGEVVGEDVPIASVSSLTLSQVQAVTGLRPTVRFMCSSAVPHPESLRFFDEAGDERAIKALKQALPGPWREVHREEFGRYTRLLIASALHCALLRETEKHVEPNPDELSFLIETLDEARRMIQAHDDSPSRALESAKTPGGLTEAVVNSGAFEQIANKLTAQ
jgi:hypothetical protein